MSSIIHDLSAQLARDGLPPDMVDDATIALAEVLNNIEEHAYQGRPGCPVLIEIWADASRFECRVEDRGTPLPGGSLPAGTMPPTDPMAPEKWPEGGFGWALLHRVTTELSYRRLGDVNRLFFAIS